MSKSTSMKPLALAIGAAFVTSLAGVSVANAAENPFGMSELSSGYMVADGKMKEGKCGEKHKKENDGKCGGKMKGEDCHHKDGHDHDKDGKKMDKKKDGKCGEAKCGEGKCGGKK